MADLPPPALKLDLDRDALAANWRALNDLSGKGRAGAAVKADAYGLGADTVVPVLRDAGASDFFVAHWCEVPGVLRHVPADQVSVLHGTGTAQEADYARSSGVRPVLNSLHQVGVWLDAGGGPCDLMVDTGINRLGLPTDALSDPILRKLKVHTVLSHLASADEDSPMNALQLKRAQLAFAAVPSLQRSLANSAGIALGKDYAFDLTRPGLALYGGIPRPELEGVIRPVARPKAALLQRRKLRAGDTVGYNATFIAPRDMTVGVVSVGYADGYLRCWTGKGMLRNMGRDLPVLGLVSMDMVVLDLTLAPDLREGDWVELPSDLPAASKVSGLTQYELLTLTGRRLKTS